MYWYQKHPQAKVEMLGFIPLMLSLKNPAPAREQLHAGYRHGGGWTPFEGFKMLANGNMRYPGDPDTLCLFETMLRDEIIRV